MGILTILLIAYLGICLVYWLAQAYAVARTLRALAALERIDAPEPQRWPTLSVVVPACNEADKLEDAFRTLLAQDYPGLEIVLVEDRSTDRTPEIADRLAAGDGRVKVVHITELPEGWLGKVNALRRGLDESSGEIVLFTDADVHFREGTLRKAVAHVVAERLDHLTVFPTLWPTSAALDATVSVFIRQLLLMVRPWGMRKGPLRSCIGIGAFNMIRRAAFERTEGFEWMRMETADDYTLAYMMKKSGARCDIVTGFEDVGLVWYRTLGEAARGAEKGFASAFRCSLPISILAPVAMCLVEASPLVSALTLVFAGFGVAWAVAAANLVLFVAAVLPLSIRARVRWWPPLLAPLMAPVLAALAMRAGILGWRHGGVAWRGKFYPSDELRAGRRAPF